MVVAEQNIHILVTKKDSKTKTEFGQGIILTGTFQGLERWFRG